MEAHSGDGEMSQLPSTPVQDAQEVLGQPSPGATKRTGPPPSRRPPPPPPLLPVTLSQAEGGSAAARAGEREEQRHKVKAKEGLEAGCAAAVFGFAVLSGCFCLPTEAKRPSNVRFNISLFLEFATFLSGKALMLLSMNMLGLREDLVSGGQHVAAQCLTVACAALSVLTLLSLVALVPSRLYQYIGLAVITVVLLPAAGVHWHLRRRADGRDEATEDEHKEELENASKTTSYVTTSAFGGLVVVLSSASKISGAAADSVDTAAYAAMFFMFATAIFGMFVLTVSKKVPEIANRRCRLLLITAIKVANVVNVFFPPKRCPPMLWHRWICSEIHAEQEREEDYLLCMNLRADPVIQSLGEHPLRRKKTTSCQRRLALLDGLRGVRGRVRGPALLRFRGVRAVSYHFCALLLPPALCCPPRPHPRGQHAEEPGSPGQGDGGPRE